MSFKSDQLELGFSISAYHLYACIVGRDVVVGYDQNIFSNYETCAKIYFLAEDRYFLHSKIKFSSVAFCTG